MGPDLAPRRMNPFRASRFKFSFKPSCKQTLSRGLGIWHLQARQSATAATNEKLRLRCLGSKFCSRLVASCCNSVRSSRFCRYPLDMLGSHVASQAIVLACSVVPSILRRNPRVLHDLRKLRDIRPKPRVEYLRRAADRFVAAGLEPLDQVRRLECLGGLALDRHHDLARRTRRHEQALPARGLEAGDGLGDR